MRIFLYNHSLRNSSFGINELADITASFNKTMVHMWFPLMLLGLYVYKIVKKE
ncbi:unnamed protein product, partial [Caenorhabditis brenneri]